MSRAYDFTKRRAASSGGRQRKKTVDAARKIRPRRASRLHVRKLSCQGSYEHGIERHPAPRNRYLQEVSRARSCSRRFALLGVSHLPRLVEAKGSYAEIHTPRAADRRSMKKFILLFVQLEGDSEDCLESREEISDLLKSSCVAGSADLPQRRGARPRQSVSGRVARV